MKKTLFSLCLLSLVVAGCQQFIEPDPVPQEPAVFVAEMEEFEAQTKTSLDENRSVVWSAGDQVAIFQGSTIADKYQVWDSDTGNTNAHFSFVKQDNGLNGDFMAGTETTIGTNVAIYPYESELSCAIVYNKDEVSAYSINNVTIPSVQNYAENSFPNKAFTMVALTGGMNDHTLKFKNVCGTLKLLLKGEIAIKTIELKGNNEEELSGNAVVNVYQDGSVPTIAFSKDASKTITLDCGEGVQLSKDVATTFMMAVPPTAFSNGFTLTITDTEGKVQEMSTNKANPIKRSVIRTMPELEVVTKADPYVWFDENGRRGYTWTPDMPASSTGHRLYTNVEDLEVEVPEDAASWLTANVGQSEDGLYHIIAKVTANIGVSRSAQVKIKSKEYPDAYAVLTINQNGCYIWFNQSGDNTCSWSPGSSAAETSYPLYTNVEDLEVEVPEDAASWAEVNVCSVDNDSYSYVVEAIVKANPGVARSTTVRIKSNGYPEVFADLTINQDAVVYYLSFDQSSQSSTSLTSLDANNKKGYAEFYSNMNIDDMELIVPDGAQSWLSVNMYKAGSENTFVIVSEANEENLGAERRAAITVRSKQNPDLAIYLSVTQAEGFPYIWFNSQGNNTKTEQFEVQGGEYVAELYTNVKAFEVVVPDDAKSWVTANVWPTDDDKYVIAVQVAANPGGPRSTTVRINAKDYPSAFAEVTVNQDDTDYYLELPAFGNQGVIYYGNDLELISDIAATVNLSTNIPVSGLEAVVNVDWLTVTFKMSDEGKPQAVFKPKKTNGSETTQVILRSKSEPGISFTIDVFHYNYE